MRTIERTTAFKRDFKREAKGRHRSILGTELRRVIVALASDEPLESRATGIMRCRTTGKITGTAM